jgi:hypothetical protein
MSFGQRPNVVIVNQATAETAVVATLSYFREDRYTKEDVKVIRHWIPERCSDIGIETPDLTALDKILES